MKGQARIYRWSGGTDDVEITELDHAPDLDFLKNAVGGWIEAVPYFNRIEVDGTWRECIAYCNEEGKIQSPPLPPNPFATRLWHEGLMQIRRDGKPLFPTGLLKDGAPSDYLVGDIIVLWGDRPFMKAQ